jgi:hypothetical protein
MRVVVVLAGVTGVTGVALIAAPGCKVGLLFKEMPLFYRISFAVTNRILDSGAGNESEHTS